MSRKYLYISLTVLIFAGLLGWLFILSQPKSVAGIDNFAKCLTEKGAIMYGAYWCPHCQSQKKLFGEAFKYVKYVECTQEVKLCEEKRIKSYPTWDFADGSKVEGEMSFQKLTEKTACEAPR